MKMYTTTRSGIRAYVPTPGVNATRDRGSRCRGTVFFYIRQNLYTGVGMVSFTVIQSNKQHHRSAA